MKFKFSKSKVAGVLAALIALLGAVANFVDSLPDAPAPAPAAAGTGGGDAGAQ